MSQTLAQGGKLKPAAHAWAPSPEALARLLDWLDGGIDSHGQQYEKMRGGW